MSYAKVRRRVGVGALVLITAAFLAYSLPPYFSGDPTRARVPSTFALHYPLLVAHVLFAAVAMTAAIPQLWRALRRRRPDIHRRIGTVYVFAAVPAGVCGWVIGAATPFGPILMVSNVVMAPLWLWFTVSGYRAARRRRFAEHRRLMILSVVLTFSIISNRIWAVVLYFTLEPFRDNIFRGNDVLYGWVLAGATGWLGWTVPLLVAQLWLARNKQVMPPSSISQLTGTRPV